MSIARKAGVVIGVLGVATAAATTVEAGEGNGRKRYRESPVYIVEQPVVVQRSPVYIVQPPPPPVIYAPAPTYYEPMYPRYDRYDRYPQSPSVNINIPLR